MKAGLKAILDAILFPVFQKVRENARRASCYPCIKSAGAYKCPDDPTSDTTSLNGLAGEVDNTTSYGLNWGVSTGFTGAAGAL